jgi:5-methylcytosine-specific restriction endonuclease McrA
MPMDRSRYPADWERISRAIRTERARGCCEWCGAVNGQPHPRTGSKVVLTVAHLGTPHADGRPGDKHDKTDVRPENLAALCQACHLNYDRDEHQQHAAETRRRKRLAAGQAPLPLDGLTDNGN